MVKAANRDLEYSCDDVVVKNSDMNFRKEYSLAILKAMQKTEKAVLSTYLNGGVSNE
jgi:beta-lactamase regulating signal transducer with metallopeptidase domain